MTDFLTTLAARTLGLAPIMQPAIASIFSPGLVVAGDGEMGGERESSGNSSLYQLATPDLPAISRLPLSQISTLAPEFNNIEFNNETGKTPISQNIEPIIESANAPTIQQPKSLPVQRLSEVEIKQSPPFQGGLGGSATSETQNMPSTQRNYYESSSTSEQQELPKELPIKSSQSNPNIPNATLPFATAPQPTQKNESQSPTLPAFNQQTQQSSATPILPLTQVEPLINQVQPDKIQPQISNQLENTSIETSSTTTSLPTQKSQSQSAPLSISNQQTQHITKSTLNLTNSQTFTPPSSVEPLINQVQPDKIQPQISNQLENTSIETSSTTTSLPTQKSQSQSAPLSISNQQTQHITKSTLNLTNSQTFTPPSSVEPLINQVQPDKIQPQISNQLENTSIETSSTTTSLPTQKSQSQSAPLSISNQQTQHITKSTLNLTNSQTFTPPSSVEPLINQVQPDKIQPQISNQLENTSIETSSTTTSLPNQKSQSQSAPLSISNQQTQHITKSTLPLTNSQTFTPPSSVEPLINHVQANEIPSLVPSQPELPINSNPRQQDIPTETSATPQIIQRKLDIISPPIPQQTSQPTPFSTSNQQVQKNITKSTSTLTRIQTVTPHSVEPLINQVQSDEIQTQAQRQDTLRETLIDNTISLSTSNEIRELDKEIKAKDVDDSKAKLSASPSFSLSPPSENVSTLQPSQRLTNVNTVVIKPLVDKIRDANIPEQTSFKSANLSQYFSQKLSQNFSQNTASKIQPVVLPQQLSVYPQFETQIESKKSGRTDKRGEAVPMQQAPTPTIQVTIGRIEVRINNQTPSQTPRTQPNKSEPKLSLQDYLKKRQGGN
ncbi:MAG: hypothetical protein ACHBN1_14260 [Heteroscytonema crispum UTEX LB 1556]